ncbi:intracellular septation protein A [Amycolatopsis lexingtonensis]|uniref:Intracellular septation protein A n=1 Tax=Amycolatopsis lexingtonensis TaxID=218822 RepID=A0ABR9IA79_9PSEU|nr:VC0807 family protein [Amycolatopsis lexingtonensis]MBE1500074.1 intracellular septation protein A [Amycolatopsis lexingtonensis]
MTKNGSPLQTLAIEIAVPIGVYYGLHALGVSVFLSLALSGVVPLARTLHQFAKNRTLNGLALVVLVTNVVGMLLTFVSGDARMMIAKDSIGSGITGLVILVSAFTAAPIMTKTIQPFLTRGKAENEAAWERLSGTAKFQRIMRRTSVIWGIGFVLESAARVVGAFTLPIETMVWLSTVIFVGAFAVIMVVGGKVAEGAAKLIVAEAKADVRPLVAA